MSSSAAFASLYAALNALFASEEPPPSPCPPPSSTPSAHAVAAHHRSFSALRAWQLGCRCGVELEAMGVGERGV
eukprot:578014-Rhodomonas_salina.1